MDLINFSSWPHDTLVAYAIIATLTLIVVAMVVFFRELGPKPDRRRNRRRRGRFGFPVSHRSKTTMRVLNIRELSADVKSFRLQPLDGYLDYEPGQFLTFHFGDNDSSSRCYSLNSSPTRPGTYEVSVKLLEGGKGSGWMHNEVAVGDELTVTPPSGRFLLNDEADQIVFVAGGIGITPCLAMLTYLHDVVSTKKIYFFFGARLEADLIFRHEIEALIAGLPNATFIPVLSRASDAWQGRRGHVDADVLNSLDIDFAKAELYTCGPEGMMDAVKAAAIDQGLPPGRFHHEAFASVNLDDVEPRQATITVDGEELAYDGKETLLDFLNANDVFVPCSCRVGVCGTCELRIVEGEVESLPSEFLSEEDKAAGQCLSCISLPKSDLTIEV